MRGHDPIKLSEFKGDVDRDSGESDPVGSFRKSLNIVFEDNDIKTRDGFLSTSGLGTFNIVRMFPYKRSDPAAADTIIFLDDDGNLYDLNWPGLPTNPTPILTIQSPYKMTDFSMVVMYNRAYITPHDGASGLPGTDGKLYVYQGGGTIRKAAGTPPGTGLSAANSSSSGNVAKGKHLISFVFETDTGFITKPAEAFLLDCSGGKKIDLSSIDTGGPEVIARHIIATQVLIKEYDGKDEDFAFYYIPNGRIDNNVDTTFTVNFFDTDLIASADDLWYSYEEIDAFLGVEEYDDKLVGWGEDGDESIIRVSKNGNPETISEPYGYVIVRPGSGGGLKACTDYRGMLMAHKSSRTYAVTPNSGDPNTWGVVDVDEGIGTEVHGISTIMDAKGHSSDRYVIADRSGLRLFTGTFPEIPISYKIENIWDRINFDKFHLIEVNIDPQSKVILINVPLDNSTVCSNVLYCDYEHGLTPDAVRWTMWELPQYALESRPYAPATIVIDVNEATKKPLYKIGTDFGLLYQETGNLGDFGLAFLGLVQWSKVRPEKSDGSPVVHWTGYRARITGAGVLQSRVYSIDGNEVVNFADLTPSDAPGLYYERLGFLQSEMASFEIQTASTYGNRFRIIDFNVYGKILWPHRPNS